MAFAHGTRSRLTRHNLDRFAGDTLFDRIAQVVCKAECLPRKELYEAWHVAKRVRRRFRGGVVVDVAAGHGLLAWILLLLDDSSPNAVCIDKRRPKSADRLAAALVERWPRLGGRVDFVERALHPSLIPEQALLVSAHGCGALTDRVLDAAITGGHRLAVLPCCQSRGRCDTGGLEPWMPVGLAVDATRVARLRGAGFTVYTATIPEEITPKNRLLLAAPPKGMHHLTGESEDR